MHAFCESLPLSGNRHGQRQRVQAVCSRDLNPSWKVSDTALSNLQRVSVKLVTSADAWAQQKTMLGRQFQERKG